MRRHQAFALTPVRVGAACIRRHLTFAVPPVDKYNAVHHSLV